MLKIADLEGQIDSLRFESSNQGVITSLKSRLTAVSRQVEEYKLLVTDKEKELSKVYFTDSSLQKNPDCVTADTVKAYLSILSYRPLPK